ncbi:MAG: hypothetical protein JWM58_1112 [Rhizobium sp.]|nr:hypothetical protein [Rhizobium sp.]
MYHFQELTSEQIRQTIDTEQIFTEWMRISREIDHRFRGAMAWKSVSGRKYLYRKTGAAWKSLGPQSEDTERTHQQFHDGRDAAKGRLRALTVRLDDMAAINRAMRIGRLPLLTARVVRALGRSGLIGTAFDIVGTNALYLYERLSGVRIASRLLATGDVDLMFDARTKLKLIGGKNKPANLMATLKTVDKSFQQTSKLSFRAANRDGFLVDVIMPANRDRLKNVGRTGIGGSGDDLVAVEIEGLEWLVNSPKVEATMIDERGYPLICSCPDPRSFALHKLWLSKREDRDPLKRIRDRQQAELVSTMLLHRLPHLRFDDPALGAIPKTLRDQAEYLRDTYTGDQRDQPNW